MLSMKIPSGYLVYERKNQEARRWGQNEPKEITKECENDNIREIM